MDFSVPTDHEVKLKESEKKDKYMDLARELKTTMEYEGDGDTNCCEGARYSHQRTDKDTRGLGNLGTSEDYPNYSIVEIGQNTEESPWDLKRLAVAQTPVEDHI